MKFKCIKGIIVDGPSTGHFRNGKKPNRQAYIVKLRLVNDDSIEKYTPKKIADAIIDALDSHRSSSIEQVTVLDSWAVL